jgi:hypothetical protein
MYIRAFVKRHGMTCEAYSRGFQGTVNPPVAGSSPARRVLWKFRRGFIFAAADWAIRLSILILPLPRLSGRCAAGQSASRG